MHYGTYKPIVDSQVQHDILNRITDEDVAMWMVARLHQIRNSGLLADRIQLHVNDRTGFRLQA